MECEAISKAALLARMDNDPRLLGDFIDLFLRDLPQVMDRLREGVAMGNAVLLRKSAHRLRGGLLQLELPLRVAATVELERMARSGDTAPAAPVLDELETAMADLVPALQSLRSELRGPRGPGTA